MPTLQPTHFGRVYAAYGGVFVVLSLLWGWWLDGHRPDAADVAGALLCLVGVAVISTGRAPRLTRSDARIDQAIEPAPRLANGQRRSTAMRCGCLRIEDCEFDPVDGCTR